MNKTNSRPPILLTPRPHWSENFLHPTKAHNHRKLRTATTLIFTAGTFGTALGTAWIVSKLHKRYVTKQSPAAAKSVDLKTRRTWIDNFLHPTKASNWRKLRVATTVIFTASTLGTAYASLWLISKLQNRNISQKQGTQVTGSVSTGNNSSVGSSTTSNTNSPSTPPPPLNTSAKPDYDLLCQQVRQLEFKVSSELDACLTPDAHTQERIDLLKKLLQDELDKGDPVALHVFANLVNNDKLAASIRLRLLRANDPIAQKQQVEADLRNGKALASSEVYYRFLLTTHKMADATRSELLKELAGIQLLLNKADHAKENLVASAELKIKALGEIPQKERESKDANLHWMIDHKHPGVVEFIIAKMVFPVYFNLPDWTNKQGQYLNESANAGNPYAKIELQKEVGKSLLSVDLSTALIHWDALSPDEQTSLMQRILREGTFDQKMGAADKITDADRKAIALQNIFDSETSENKLEVIEKMITLDANKGHLMVSSFALTVSEQYAVEAWGRLLTCDPKKDDAICGLKSLTSSTDPHILHRIGQLLWNEDQTYAKSVYSAAAIGGSLGALEDLYFTALTENNLTQANTYEQELLSKGDPALLRELYDGMVDWDTNLDQINARSNRFLVAAAQKGDVASIKGLFSEPYLNLTTSYLGTRMEERGIIQAQADQLTADLGLRLTVAYQQSGLCSAYLELYQTLTEIDGVKGLYEKLEPIQKQLGEEIRKRAAKMTENELEDLANSILNITEEQQTLLFEHKFKDVSGDNAYAFYLKHAGTPQGVVALKRARDEKYGPAVVAYTLKQINIYSANVTFVNILFAIPVDSLTCTQLDTLIEPLFDNQFLNTYSKFLNRAASEKNSAAAYFALAKTSTDESLVNNHTADCINLATGGQLYRWSQRFDKNSNQRQLFLVEASKKGYAEATQQLADEACIKVNADNTELYRMLATNMGNQRSCFSVDSFLETMEKLFDAAKTLQDDELLKLLIQSMKDGIREGDIADKEKMMAYCLKNRARFEHSLPEMFKQLSLSDFKKVKALAETSYCSSAEEYTKFKTQLLDFLDDEAEKGNVDARIQLAKHYKKSDPKETDSQLIKAVEQGSARAKGILFKNAIRNNDLEGIAKWGQV